MPIASVTSDRQRHADQHVLARAELRAHARREELTDRVRDQVRRPDVAERRRVPAGLARRSPTSPPRTACGRSRSRRTTSHVAAKMRIRHVRCSGVSGVATPEPTLDATAESVPRGYGMMTTKSVGGIRQARTDRGRCSAPCRPTVPSGMHWHCSSAHEEQPGVTLQAAGQPSAAVRGGQVHNRRRARRRCELSYGFGGGGGGANARRAPRIPQEVEEQAAVRRAWRPGPPEPRPSGGG